MRIRVVDVETTGLSPADDVVELGFCDVVLDAASGRWRVGPVRSRLFRPAQFDIPAEASAVHHITDEDIPADAPAGTPIALGGFLFEGPRPDVLAAHNAAFEQQWLSPVDQGLPWICTWKAALRLHPNAPGHGNQALRYDLGLEVDRTAASPPHRAGPDAYVTAHLLVRLLADAPVRSMVAWTTEPAVMPRMPFGKHARKVWADVPHDYLCWLMHNCRESQPDAVWNAERELQQRATVVAANL